MTLDQEGLKEQAAREALTSVRSHMRLGLGTGSTVAHFLNLLGKALLEGRLEDIAAVPTSTRTEVRCRELHIPLLGLDQAPPLDLAVDGADEVDPECRLIKGLGGALLREKMVALAAREVVIMVDSSKVVERLGTKSPLPVEVVPFAWKTQLPYLAALGARPQRRQAPDGRPYITDNGGFILDCTFEGGIPDPTGLGDKLKAHTGIVEHGLFLGLCTLALVATPAGVLHKTPGPAANPGR